jgi:hypothetical protein
MMAVPVVVKSSTLELGSPVALFFAGFGRHPFRFEYAVSRDGRFLRNYNVAEEPTPPITIVLNPKL